MADPTVKLATGADDQKGEAPNVAKNAALPLIVDMDGTLLRTDTLFEAIADQLRVRPLWTLWQLICLPFGIARGKARIQGQAEIDVETLPVNEDVLNYCYRERDRGRPVWLVSAADQPTVQAVADRFGIFDRAIGSDGKHNKKGGAKARYLQETFPDGFEYVGDSPADMKVWAASARASIVGHEKSRATALNAAGIEIGRTFSRSPNRLTAWRKAMRPHQWAKNFLIFVAPLLAMQLANPTTFLNCVIGFLLTGVLASGTYIFNDVLDVQADRVHHTKKRRPFAAGQIKLWQGFVAAPLLVAVGLTGAAFLSTAFLVTLGAYLLVTLSYSLFLKRVPLLDAATLGFLFTLRLLMGGAIAGVPLTQWLIVFSMFLFFSLSLAKRHVEIVRKVAAGQNSVKSRGYHAGDATLTLALGLATTTATPIIIVLYMIESAWPSGAYAAPEALWAIPGLLALWLMRVWLLANRGELDDDPVVFAIKDPLSLTLGAALAAAFAWATFGLPIEAFERYGLVTSPAPPLDPA